jgi:hypothetical protein
VSQTCYLIYKLMDKPTMFSMECNLLIDKTLARICLVIRFILMKLLSEFLGFLLLGLLCKMKDYQPSICNSVCCPHVDFFSMSVSHWDSRTTFAFMYLHIIFARIVFIKEYVFMNQLHFPK